MCVQIVTLTNLGTSTLAPADQQTLIITHYKQWLGCDAQLKWLFEGLRMSMYFIQIQESTGKVDLMRVGK